MCNFTLKPFISPSKSLRDLEVRREATTDKLRRFAPPLGLITRETFSGTDEPTPCKTDTRGANSASNTVRR